MSVTFGWAEAIFRKRPALNFKDAHSHVYLRTAFPLPNHQLDPAVLWRPKLNRLINRIYSRDPDYSGWPYTLVGGIHKQHNRGCGVILGRFAFLGVYVCASSRSTFCATTDDKST